MTRVVCFGVLLCLACQGTVSCRVQTPDDAKGIGGNWDNGYAGYIFVMEPGELVCVVWDGETSLC